MESGEPNLVKDKVRKRVYKPRNNRLKPAPVTPKTSTLLMPSTTASSVTPSCSHISREQADDNALQFEIVENEATPYVPTAIPYQPSLQGEKKMCKQTSSIDKVQPGHEQSPFCNFCTFQKHHLNFEPNPTHKTCICNVFTNRTACCKIGLMNLYYGIPSIIIFAPNVNCWVEDYFKGVKTGTITLSWDKYKSIIDFNVNIKQELLHHIISSTRSVPFEIVP